MFLVFLKILVPFLAVNISDLRSIEHFIKVFTLRVLPSLSKLLKRRLDNKFCGQMVAVSPENLVVEILIRDYCVKNSKKTEIL